MSFESMKTLIRKISPQHVGQISGTKPVLIQGLCKHWPAVVHIGSENSGNSDSQSWSLSNLKRRLQHRLVQIEVGGDYMHENMTVNTVPFEIFADFLESDLASTALADDSPRVYVREQQIYLAQQELADVEQAVLFSGAVLGLVATCRKMMKSRKKKNKHPETKIDVMGDQLLSDAQHGLYTVYVHVIVRRRREILDECYPIEDKIYRMTQGVSSNPVLFE